MNLKALILIAAITVSAQAKANEIIGKVVKVLDGDTITLLVECAQLELPVRLAGIDAPETGAPFGLESKESLSRLLSGRTVAVESHKRDKYGRYVGRILVDGLDANLAQINKGMAWHYKAYTAEQKHEDRSTYAAAELFAKEQKTGLWAHKDPIPPWDWRKGVRPQEQASITPDSQQIHIGPRGGRYIILPSGAKRYLPKDE